MKVVLLIIISTFHLAASSFSQGEIDQTLTSIGPANLQQESGSSIYIFRRSDDMTNYYYGLAINDENGLYAKVRSGQAYNIHTFAQGNTRLFFNNIGNIHEHIIDLQSGSSHYFELKVNKVASGTAALIFELSDAITFNSFIEENNKEINHCYSRISSSQAEYLSSFDLEDSILWQFDESRSFSTIIPSNVDLYNKGARPSLVFFNPFVSNTYSEAVYLIKSKKVKFKSIEEYKKYLEDDFVNSLNGIVFFSKEVKQKYVVVAHDVVPFSNYSSLVLFEFRDYNALNKGSNEYLLIRVYAAVFLVNHSDGNQYLYYLALSERGIGEELHSEDNLLTRFYPIYQSLQLKNVGFNIQLKK